MGTNSCACCVALLLFQSVAHAQRVSNPEYELWSRFGKGGAIEQTYRMKTFAITLEGTRTTTCTLLTRGKIVLQEVDEVELMGIKQKQQRQREVLGTISRREHLRNEKSRKDLKKKPSNCPTARKSSAASMK